jgi:Nuclease-related domain/UvrD-like helicase C-terminal domain/AAA domain
MARMIPSFVDERTPPGERDVFNLIAGGPPEYTVIHSLDLAPWNRGLRTEIDFLVIDPVAGIICIEVKSHDHIAFDGERWHPESIVRSPFKQAADARHTFYRRLSELEPSFKRIPIVHCCIFPRSAFELPANMSIQRWEVIDGRQFRRFESSAALLAEIRARIGQSIDADAALSGIDRPLTAGEIGQIVRLCVPIQKRNPDRREEIARREEDMDRILRRHQRPAVQLGAANRTLIVSGGAGTGKTLIAMEIARRAAARGNRVALLCFNQLVGGWIRRQMERSGPLPPNLLVGRAIRVLADMAAVDIPIDAPSDFWDVVLPSRLEEQFTDPEFASEAKIDYLVVDEAQDILARPWLWGCLIQLLGPNARMPTFALLGDFDNQVLNQRSTMQKSLDRVLESSNPTLYRLTENCRNYRIVGDTAVTLAGLDGPVYEDYLRLGGGMDDYDIHFYKDDAEQERKIGEILAQFKAKGYRPSEIVLLSLRADDTSAASRLKRSGWRLRPAWQESDATAFASIHAYKGMENKIVILTDMYLQDLHFHRDLFYTAMTRATESVRVLCDMRSQETLRHWLSERFGHERTV